MARPKTLPIVSGVLLVLFVAAPVTAHPDLAVLEGTQTIEEALAIPVQLHYHRVVGHVRAEDAAQLLVRVTGPGGETHIAGPGSDLVLNQVVRCCKGTTWAPHTLLIENTDSAPLQADIRIVLLHDGLAVIGEDAEPGAVATTLAWFIAFSLLFVHRLAKGRLPAAPARPWALAVVLLHAAQWLLMAPLALAGMLRYGGGPVAGTLAITADLPWTGDQIFTTHSLLFAIPVFLWVAVAGTWTAAARRTHDPRRVGWIGVGIGAGILAATLLWAVEYGYLLAPIVLGAGAAALPLAGGIRTLRRRAADESSAA